MRRFLVLGFVTNLKQEVGEQLYLGSDRDQANTETKDSSGVFLRKACYEVDIPILNKKFPESE